MSTLVKECFFIYLTIYLALGNSTINRPDRVREFFDNISLNSWRLVSFGYWFLGELKKSRIFCRICRKKLIFFTYVTNFFDFAATFSNHTAGKTLVNEHTDIVFVFLLEIYKLVKMMVHGNIISIMEIWTTKKWCFFVDIPSFKMRTNRNLFLSEKCCYLFEFAHLFFFILILVSLFRILEFTLNTPSRRVM